MRINNLAASMTGARPRNAVLKQVREAQESREQATLTCLEKHLC